ncbi:YciI family protein [Streptomyces indicus]|uniref:YCII-related domain-containing protein n=1 Tax=Streptomyces indicus TaxID=417292 RepID=A0A1G8TB37_9ACTN|nr:YciI family protein [Streptomyces indicus]SDJ38713.1 hypothetical protein SAMN05421806_101158 [Streptomyces indicus]
MLFYVYAEDAPGVQDRMIDRAEEHWSYMDGFADRLVLRGPTLSADGEEHTGSVHVVDVPDRTAAERFATQEPYWKAGLYREFRADRMLVERHGEIGREQDMTLVCVRRPPRPLTDGPIELGAPEQVLAFTGLLVDDEAAQSTGFVAVLRTLSEAVVEEFTGRVAGAGTTVTTTRWCRGGRH